MATSSRFDNGKKVLTAQSALNTTSNPIYLGGNLNNHHAMQITTNGTVTGGVVALERSLDGLNWESDVSTTLTTTGTIVQGATDYPAMWLRVKITTAITGGGTVDVRVATQYPTDRYTP